LTKSLRTRAGDRRWQVVGLLSLGMLIGQLNRSDLAVAMPVIAADFHWGETDQGLLLSSFYWTYSLFLVPAGLIADRFGARLLFFGGFVLWSLSSAACGLATSLGAFLIFRMLIGAGEAALTPAAMRYIRSNFAEERRGTAIGVYLMSTKIGPGIGFPLTAYLLAAFGWRTTFVVIGIGGLVCLLSLWAWLFSGSESVSIESKDPTSSTPTSSWRDLVPLLGRVELWGILIGTFCYFYFLGYCNTWMPAYLSREHGMSIKESGWYSGFAFGGMALVALFAGWAADALIRRGYDPLAVRKGFTIAGLAIAASQTLAIWYGSPRQMVFAAVFSLAGLGLTMPNYWAVTQTLMPAGNIGAVTAVQSAVGHLAAIAAPWITGRLVEQSGSFDAPVRAAGWWLLIGVASYLFLVRRPKVPKGTSS